MKVLLEQCNTIEHLLYTNVLVLDVMLGQCNMTQHPAGRDAGAVQHYRAYLLYTYVL